MQVSAQRKSAGPAEQEVLEHLVGHLDTFRPEAVVKYYLALKNRRFVILVGPPGVDKTLLVQGLAEVLVGQLSLQWCLFQAHPWWTTQTGEADYYADAHMRFNTLKLLDFIELAAAGEVVGLPFFVCLERMSLAEVMCYFEDLPRGLLWLADGSTRRIDLPGNLYVTGTLDVAGENSFSPSQDVYRHAVVIHLDHDDFTPGVQLRRSPPRRLDWQQWFVKSTVHRIDGAGGNWFR